MKFDDFPEIPWWGPRLRSHTRGRVTRLSVAYSKQVTKPRLLTCKQLQADTRLANWQLQTAGLEITGKPDCQLVIEGLEGLGTVGLQNMPRSLVAP